MKLSIILLFLTFVLRFADLCFPKIYQSFLFEQLICSNRKQDIVFSVISLVINVSLVFHKYEFIAHVGD